MARVLNIRDFGFKVPEGAVYIGRQYKLIPESKWHNPYHIGKDGTRGQVIKKYRKHLLTCIASGYLNPTELRDKDLACFCAPLPCHGSVLLEFANYEDGGKQ